MKQPVMVGERVYLTILQPDDGIELARLDVMETDTGLFDTGRVPVGPLAWEKLIRSQVPSSPPDGLAFAIRLIENEEWIGVVQIGDIDWIHQTGESATFMKPGRFRGQGYGTEAKMLMLEYGFEHLHLHMICSHVLETNQRSASALLKQGYRPAGRMRYQVIKDGIYVDNLLFDITRDDWFARKRERAGSR